ncbi:MAG: hypothetical protein MUF14_02125 [Hyphomonadaceae bacterium]|nr:hypothetical protein [Hyphomonadaceae bacterium]
MRGVRSLEMLSKRGSTTRVLNLHRVNELALDDPDYLTRPFFNDRLLNRAMFIKHRLRRDELYMMPRKQRVATKIIFPFAKNELRVGGQAIFVGQNGYKQALAEILGPETPQTRRDLDLLNLMQKLPSLDPFLLREEMRRHGFDPADCYFEITPADIERMHAYAADQVSGLINKAFGGSGSEVPKEHIDKLVDALLSNNADDRLDPLRLTLGLEGQAFKDGIFSWKGFLYYKWQLDEARASLFAVSSQLDQVRLIGKQPSEMKEEIAQLQRNIRTAVRIATADCNRIMGLYDQAFHDLVENSKAAAFRKFLLDAPRLFLELGLLMGVISHIASFWTYRFPKGSRLEMDAAEYLDLLQEFDNSLDTEVKPVSHAA